MTGRQFGSGEGLRNHAKPRSARCWSDTLALCFLTLQLSIIALGLGIVWWNSAHDDDDDDAFADSSYPRVHSYYNANLQASAERRPAFVERHALGEDPSVVNANQQKAPSQSSKQTGNNPVTPRPNDLAISRRANVDTAADRQRGQQANGTSRSSEPLAPPPENDKARAYETIVFAEPIDRRPEAVAGTVAETPRAPIVYGEKKYQQQLPEKPIEKPVQSVVSAPSSVQVYGEKRYQPLVPEKPILRPEEEMHATLEALRRSAEEFNARSDALKPLIERQVQQSRSIEAMNQWVMSRRQSLYSEEILRLPRPLLLPDERLRANDFSTFRILEAPRSEIGQIRPVEIRRIPPELWQRHISPSRSPLRIRRIGR
jgi:hypothetical protein